MLYNITVLNMMSSQ